MPGGGALIEVELRDVKADLREVRDILSIDRQIANLKTVREIGAVDQRPVGRGEQVGER